MNRTQKIAIGVVLVPVAAGWVRQFQRVAARRAAQVANLEPQLANAEARARAAEKEREELCIAE